MAAFEQLVKLIYNVRGTTGCCTTKRCFPSDVGRRPVGLDTRGRSVKRESRQAAWRQFLDAAINRMIAADIAVAHQQAQRVAIDFPFEGGMKTECL